MTSRRRLSTGCTSALPASCLAALLTVGVPIFLAMGLWVDATLYDVGARTLMDGGVYYRDLFDTNLPGMVWLHVVVRALFGWSPQAIRAVDLVVVAGIVWILSRWFRPPAIRRPTTGLDRRGARRVLFLHRRVVARAARRVDAAASAWGAPAAPDSA